MHIATIMTGHSTYADDVWKLICGARFCNEFTPVGWLLYCGCQTRIIPEFGGEVAAPRTTFYVEIDFDGPLELLLQRLRHYIEGGEVGHNCEGRQLQWRLHGYDE